MRNLKFHLTIFLFYHERLQNKNWGSLEEEEIVRSQERKYAELAAKSLTEYAIQSGILNQPQPVKKSVRKFIPAALSRMLSYMKNDHHYSFTKN